MTRYRHANVENQRIFYREAGALDAPAILLLHGFPSSSHMFRDLIPILAERYRVVAPDLPGFGFSDCPQPSDFAYTFDNLAKVIDRFAEAVGLRRYAIYVFDYGAPVGFRLAVMHPDRVTAIITQNGNAYIEGLSDGWNPVRAYWQAPTLENRKALRSFLAPETTVFQYTHGVSDPTCVSPDGYTMDDALLARTGNDEIQLDLLLDYRSNIEAYPRFHDYFRKHQPPLLAVWGKNDPFFLPAGAEAFKRDLPEADIRFFDTGHFALETHAAEIGSVIRDFLGRAASTDRKRAAGPADLARSFYSALAHGDIAKVLDLLHPDLSWTEAEGFPYYSGTWRSPQEIVDKLLIPLDRDWDDFAATPQDFIESGDRAVAVGFYSGTAKATGKSMRAPFAHVWSVRDGKLASFDMHTDTVLVRAALS